jgi:Txe/YoeB family toxin of Txe-Axe toxin-antitoxin module
MSQPEEEPIYVGEPDVFGPQFDSNVCITCPANNKCEAFEFMSQVKEETDDRAEELETYTGLVTELLEDPFPNPDSTEELAANIDNHRSRMLRAQRRYTNSVSSGEILIRSLLAIPDEAGSPINTDEVLFQTPLDDFLAADERHGLNSIDASTETLRRLVDDVNIHIGRGRCTAISKDIILKFPSR